MQYTTARFFYFLLLIFCGMTAPFSVFSQEAESVFSEFSRLEGVWFMPTDRGDRLEVWDEKDDSTMIGRGMRIRIENGDTVTLENLRLERRGEVITYYATVRGQNNNQPVAFTLTEWGYGDFLFENPTHDDPKKIRYRLLGNRELQVTTEGERNGKATKTEFVFEREFTPGGIEVRLRAGLNVYSLRQTGNFETYIPGSNPQEPAAPDFSLRPGWELGWQFAFKGRGGFLTINLEAGLSGKFAHAVSGYFDYTDTVEYIRDVTYNTTWFNVALLPEFRFKRDGKFSVMVGPYIGLNLFNRTKGEETPGGENKLFDSNKDFRKREFGLIAGFEWDHNIGKKDIGGTFGLRSNLGISNIDNLYDRGCTDPALCNGKISFSGISAYYSINLTKL